MTASCAAYVVCTLPIHAHRIQHSTAQHTTARTTLRGCSAAPRSPRHPKSVPTWAAVPISVTGALLYLASSELLLRLRIDDPLDAAPLHLTCGAWGAISIGLFGSKVRPRLALVVCVSACAVMCSV